MTYFANTVCINDSCVAQRCNFPTGKVDRHIRFGGLRYSTYSYFAFISRIEKVYANILSEEYIIVFGSNIVDKMSVALIGQPLVSDLFVGFLPPDI